MVSPLFVSLCLCVKNRIYQTLKIATNHKNYFLLYSFFCQATRRLVERLLRLFAAISTALFRFIPFPNQF